jgi:Matrixin
VRDRDAQALPSILRSPFLEPTCFVARSRHDDHLVSGKLTQGVLDCLKRIRVADLGLDPPGLRTDCLARLACDTGRFLARLVLVARQPLERRKLNGGGDHADLRFCVAGVLPYPFPQPLFLDGSGGNDKQPVAHPPLVPRTGEEENRVRVETRLDASSATAFRHRLRPHRRRVRRRTRCERLEVRLLRFQDLRTSGVTEYRDASGRLIWRDVALGERRDPGTECGDSRHTFIGARWASFPAYRVNLSNLAEVFPREQQADAALADLQAAHSAWENPWTTDCTNVPGLSPYMAMYGGPTDAPASLAVGELDGVNAVAFRPLAGTLCFYPGVVACVVAWSEAGRFVEADMALASDLDRLGDFGWTTGDTTWSSGNTGEFAVSDVATHEWGHFAGLGHTKKSPSLTMYPAIRDGMQTLGLGDMKGLLARY